MLLTMNLPLNGQDHPGLQTVTSREDALLAPYAVKSADCRGRKHPEPAHAYRGAFQRDRDRIVHSTAFRRLSDKTQVFTGQSDYHRTRLTHTMEVASLARTIGRALGLNEDLIEALALLHDIGHPPFGHAGEDALQECLADDGGFSHNRYGLTVVEHLEIRYEAFPGLNLTLDVLEGQTSRIDKTTGPRPPLEVQVVDAADSITYDAHDTDDALEMGILSLDDLREIPLLRDCSEQVQQRGPLPNDRLCKAIVHELMDRQVADVLQFTGQFLVQAKFASARDAQQSGFLVGPSPDLVDQKAQLESFLYDRVYRHPDIVAVRQTGQTRLRQMFNACVAKPNLLPAFFLKHAETVGLRCSIGDYLASLTDRSCELQYANLCGGE